MTAREFTINSLVEAGIVPEAFEDDALALLVKHDTAHRAEVLNGAADAIDAGGPGSECDCCTGAAALLRRMATNGKASPAGPTATRERTITHTSPSETPNLTIRLLFSDAWTDDGVNEITDRVTLAARHGYTAVPAADARIVAYRAPSGYLYCRTCCSGTGMYAGLTSDDLPDGGFCDECRVDVLIFADETRDATPSTTTQRIEYALTSPKYALHGPYLIAARDLQEAHLVAADDPGSQIVQRTVTTTTTLWSKAGEAR